MFALPRAVIESVRGGIPRGPLDLDRTALFAFLLAFQMFEEKSEAFRPHSLVDWGVVATTLLLLYTPGSLYALAAFAAVQIYSVYDESPWVVNHAIFLALINAGLLWRIGAHWRARGLASGTAPQLIDAYEPAVRWLVCAMYWFAGFHKLNAGFFDPAGSCFVDSYAALRLRLPLLPPLATWGAWIGIVGSVSLELLLPFLLMYRRTRLFGFIVGFGFHLFLGMRHARFSLVVLAVYPMFMPQTAIDSLLAPLRRTWLGRMSWSAFISGIIAVFGLLWWVPKYAFEKPDDMKLYFGQSWFIPFGLLLIVFIALARRVPKARMQAPISMRLDLLGAALLALITFNGLTPYLGLKTATSFAMYSNLRTEGWSNHFIIPHGALQIVDWQDDLVTPLASSDPWIASVVKDGYRMPYIQLRAAIAGIREAHVKSLYLKYERGGKVYEFQDALSDREFKDLPSPLFRRLAPFRAVPPPNCNECRW